MEFGGIRPAHLKQATDPVEPWCPHLLEEVQSTCSQGSGEEVRKRQRLSAQCLVPGEMYLTVSIPHMPPVPICSSRAPCRIL